MGSFTSLDELFAALADERPGDVVTALAHALQCAWLLKQQRPDDEELQLAGLVHDVASSLEPPPSGCHAAAGADLVRPLFGDRVAALVAGHVTAKRWLVTCDPEYRSRLSDESKLTLSRQGEELSASERATFEATAHAADCVLLRRADDEAKQPGRVVPPLESWRPVAERALEKSTNVRAFCVEGAESYFSTM
jgi:predicted HD phosphohydrolase